jgi:phosphoribosylformimino-5-aminoimidazole carboxamide ribotide isomerase
VRAGGWLEDTGADAVAFVQRLTAQGVRDVLATAIERDGTGAGPDTELLTRLRPHVPGVLIAAGGISSARDVRAAVAAGADGIVIGRALYDGSLTFREASASLRSSPIDNPS